MRYQLLDLIRCPYCGHYPLELIVIEKREVNKTYNVKKPFCSKYCSYLGKFVDELEEAPDCDSCLRVEIVTGVIRCGKCGAWFPVINSIPEMYPLKMRARKRAKREKEFLEKIKGAVPSETYESLRRWFEENVER